MKRALLLLCVSIFICNLSAKDIVFKNDNGSVQTAGYPSTWMLEETKFLYPPGPCTVKEIQVYFTGTTAGTDTLYVVGDPAEGSVAPTFWCLSYNQKIPPIIFNYDGKPGWKNFPITGLHLDGLDRFVIQHRIQPNGPWFAFDNDGVSGPDLTSWWMNPFQNNSLGGPGQYYQASGDFLVRILVEYDYPDGDGSMPAPAPVMYDVTKHAGLTDANGNTINASEVSVQDVNNDGWDDIILGSYLFINNKDGKFKLNNEFQSIGTGANSWGDFDNDGNIDFYALRNGAYNQNTYMVVNRDQLYHNDGNLKFTPVISTDKFSTPYPSPGKDFNLPNKYDQDSIFNPYPCITPVWLDYNGDGKLDLYLANNRVGFNNSQGQYTEVYFPDQLWKQGNDGKFSNTTSSAGISNGEASPYFDCYGSNFIDYNQDNKQDIFVANYRLAKDNLFKNKGDGTFSEVAAITGVQGVPTAEAGYFGHGMGSEWADFNNDGMPDLSVGNLGHPDWRALYSNPSLIFRNDGPPNYKFTEMHSQMGLKFYEMNAGMLWGDFDLDGYQDLWHGQISYVPISAGNPMRPGLLYMNQGAPNYTLKDMTWQYGCAVHGPWSAARIDFDHDGDLDLLVISSFQGMRLFRNDMPKKGTWIALRLKGSPADKVNMDAYGTKVTCYLDGKKYFRELGSTSGTRCNQNSSELHFGIGSPGKSTLDSMIVVYPNGMSKVFTNVALGKRYSLPYMGSLAVNGSSAPQLVYPQNFATGLKPTDTKLGWYKTPNADAYTITIYADAQMTQQVQVATITDTTYSIKTLTNNKTYYWTVIAMSASVPSPVSSSWNFTVGNLVPLAPTLSSPAKASNENTLNPKLVWNPASYDAFYSPKTLYELNISKNSDFSQPVKSYTNIDSLRYYIADTLTDNTKYYWRVRAWNGDADGPWSEVWNFTSMTLPASPVLTKPADGETNVKIRPNMSWSNIADANLYHLQISLYPGFDSIFYNSENISSSTMKLLKALDNGKVFYWRVRSIKNGYYGQWSKTFSFTVEPMAVEEEPQSEGIDLKLTPNPADNFIDVSITSDLKDNFSIEVYSLPGVLLKTIEAINTGSGVFNQRIETSDLYTGIYMIKVSCGNHNAMGTFVKLR